MKEAAEIRPGGSAGNAGAVRPHSLWVSEREEVTVRGVTEVLSFDDSTVRLTTTRGALTLEGQGMRVTALDTEGGVVSVTGLLFGAFYTDGDGGGFPACSGDMPRGTDVWKYRRGCWGRCSRCRL